MDWSRWSGTTTMWDRNTSTDKGRFLPFPPDEVLLFNNSENIKQKLKNITNNIINSLTILLDKKLELFFKQPDSLKNNIIDYDLIKKNYNK